MKTVIILSVLCFFFFSTTAFLVWYIRGILSKLLYVSESMGDFMIVVDNYANHLDTVYNMETFYGDETLQSLLQHTAAVVEEIEQFESIYTLTTDLEAEQDEPDDEEELPYDDEEERSA
tara:strand:- start:2227 stop:2583 length:357 start_codon:yes stop_codon:yes gene_type:complete